MRGHRSGVSWVGGAVCLLVVTVGSGGLRAQTAYRAANGPTSIIPRTTGFGHIDFAEAGLSLVFLKEFDHAGVGVGPYIGAAARKGQYDIFSAFQFNPGFEAGLLGFVSLGEATSALSLTLGYRSTERKLYEYSGDSTTITLSEDVQKDLIATVGASLSLSSELVGGLAGSLRRERSSPGVATPEQVCVYTRGEGGLTVPMCSSRYGVALEDYWTGQVRGDVMWNVIRLGSSASQLHLALIGAASLDIGQRANARVNLGTGVAVVPVLYPGHVFAVVFVEMYDATDANAYAPSLADRLIIRLAIGVPFKLLLRDAR